MFSRIMAAVGFLTIIPVPAKYATTEAFAGSNRVYPLVGLLLGGLLALGALAFAALFPPLVVAVLLVGLWLKLTGALHLDGLADTADGLLSHRPRERALEIMRDSRIGVMGTAALVLVVLLKVAGLSALEHGNLWRALLLAPVVGRCAILLLQAFLPCARKEGLGAASAASVCDPAAAAGSGGGLRPVALLWAAAAVAFGGILLGVGGAGAVMLALALAGGLGYYALRRIGGYTGDVLGAGCEAAEMWTVVLLTTRSIL